MKLHLPAFLRKSLLSCLSAVIVCTVGSGAAWAEAQNLTFSDSYLTWNTQSESFVNEAGNAAAFAEGDNVSFTGESNVALGQDITAGVVAIEQGAAVAIDLDVFELNVDRIELSGLLDMGYSLHIGEGTTLAVQSAGAVLDSNLVLGDKGGFEVGAAASLNDNTLTLQGNTSFTLTAAGDGKTYTLLSGVSGLLDAQGNAISLDSSNNAASLYFDASQPGTGFWANGTLQLNDGALQMVLHNETVKEAITITTRQENSDAYQYYAGVRFENISITSTDADVYGGAIYGDSSSTIALSNNGSVVFEGNTASSSDSDAYGGAIYGDSITLSNNGSVTFSENCAYSYYSTDSFSGNTASGSSYVHGGAICASNVDIIGNGDVTFSENCAYSYYSSINAPATISSLSFRGGAIHSGNETSISGNGSVNFTGNSAGRRSSSNALSYSDVAVIQRDEMPVPPEFWFSSMGGAIYASNVSISGNVGVTFSGNNSYSAPDFTSFYHTRFSNSYGGAIYANYGAVSISENGDVAWSGNYAQSIASTSEPYHGTTTASSYGGAIYADRHISMSGNRMVSFAGNYAESTATSFYSGYGDYDGDSVASSYGGAIYTLDYVCISGNGDVNFSGNFAKSSTSASGHTSTTSYGGAIYAGGDISISGNGNVLFSGNSAQSSISAYGDSTISAYGGAIYVSGNLSIRNNESVLFEQNAEITDGIYRLRSIVGGGNGGVISLSAAAGKSIEFRDSIYIDSGSSFKLNEAYEGKAQLGDIIFTGATTVDDLYTVKDNVAGTTEEIRLSRTSGVNTLTELYGGRLRVEEGAIYQGRGITAMEGSGATVRVQNATLSLSGCDLTFNAGTTLELTGANTITGNLNLLDGSTLHIDFAGNEFTTNLNGSPLALTGDAFLRLTGAGNGDGKTYTLLSGVSGLLDAEGNAITLDSTNNAISNYFDADHPGTGFWENGTLQLNNGALQLVLHDQAVKEAITITTRQENSDAYQYYAGVRFENISSSADGGAIFGGSDSLITLSNNGSVIFSGNRSSCGDDGGGGAIFGGSDSLITLSNNGSVIFSGNMSSYVAGGGGGAIYGRKDSTIMLSNNDSVTFSGNTASTTDSSGDADGGAICGDSITLNNNGIVMFEGNTASATDGGFSASGGAIYGSWGGRPISLSNNGSVTFSGNTASTDEGPIARGGAIFGGSDSLITLTGNGSVVFEGNMASAIGSTACSYGGAIYGAGIMLSNNGSVTFSGNMVRATSLHRGGAICTDGDLSIRNNDSVEFYQNAEVFYQNAEVRYGFYRLRSIVAEGRGDEISLSAAAGKNITFRDSIYIMSGSTFKLNEDYTYLDEEGVSITVKQKGDIIFTGATTVDDLYEVKGNIAGTEEEIRLSRTTEVNALTNLYGGRLRVEDGAIYQGYGITAHAGSEATVLVKDATLSHSGYDLTFNAGTTLELTGVNTITGNVQMLEGSTLRFDFGADALSSLTGSLSFEDAATLQVAGYGAGLHELLRLNGSTVSGWDALSFTDGAGESVDAADFAMAGDSLFYRNGEAMNLIWTNAAGDALWNNQSLNWEADEMPYAVSVLQNVIFAAGGNETITMVGNQVVESLTVQQGGQFVLNGNADGTTLTVREEVLMEGNTALTVRGNLEAAAINAQGSLEVTGNLAVAGQLTAGSLTLTDATATHTIGGNVTLSGAATVAGTLEVSGSFTSGAVQVKKLMADGTVSTGAISSSDNSLTATGNMTTGAVTGDRNELTSSGGYVLLRDNAALNGSSNKLNAAHVVQVGTITGDGNELVAGKHVDINGSLNGDENSITCNATVNTTDNAIDISGTIGSATNTADDNALYAVRGNIRTGAITGSGNTLTAQDGNITTGAITGNDNVLSAVNGVVTAGAIAGTGNVVTAKSLQAAGMEGASLTLTDATATNRIDGNVTLSGAATVAGMLEVEGDVAVSGQVTAASLQAGSLTAGSLTAGSLTLTDATATNTVSGNAALSGAVNVAGALQVGGDLTLESGSSVSNHTISVGGAVTMSGSALTSTVISGATGNISISNSRLTTSGVETTSGNATITGTLATTQTAKEYANESEKSGGIKSFTTSLAKVGAGSSVITSVKVKERDSNGTQDTTTPLRMVIKDAAGNVIATSTNTVTLSNTKEYREFEFAPTLLDPAASYTFAFVDATTGAVKSVSLQLEDQRNNGSVALGDVTALTDKYATAKLGALVQFGYLGSENQLLGATVTTGNGALNLSGTYVAAANGQATSLNSQGGTATISSSVIAGGTNVAAGVLVIDGSKVLGNVHLETKGQNDSYINVKGGSLINIDGGAAHDASVYVGSNLSIWNDGALAGNALNIANADVQVGNITNLNGEITTNLTNVYALNEAGEISASYLGKVYASNKNGKRGVLSIAGSVIEMYGIQSSTYGNWNLDGTNPGHYFDEVNVADSTVTVNHRGHIKALTLESDSMVSILGGAYLDATSIDGTSTLITGGASKLDEVNMVDGATLRVTNTGNGVTTLANLNPGSTGTVTVDVVNGTLQTPVVNERVALGLNGGTLLIKAVEAHGTALGASVAAVNPHVVLASVSNAGAAEVTQISTIRMDGLNRLGSDEAKNDGIASLTVKGAFDADKITINAYKLATDEGNTSGFIQIDGALTGADNILNADAHILVKGVLSGSGNTLTAYNGNVTLNATNQSLNGSNNTISATGGNVNLTDDAIGSNNVISATAVTNAAGQKTGGSILSANKWASIVGDTNTLTADADILLESIGSESVAGNNNVLTAGDSITFNGTGNGTGINGSGNTLTAGTSIASRNIKGDRNQLTADEITATIVDGSGNELTGTSVDITGELKGSANTIEGNVIHVGTLSGTAQEIISNGVVNAADIAIDIDTVCGLNAIIGVQNEGSLHIDNMTAQTGAGDTGTFITVNGGNVAMGTLNTTAATTISVGASYGITVGSGTASNQNWTADSLSITEAEGLTLTDSTVTVAGAVTSDALLALSGDSTLTAASVQAGTLRLEGAGSMLSADSVVAGEVEVCDRLNNAVEFGEIVADKVTVTNSSSDYTEEVSVGDGSVIGELVADKLEVREGTATLGSTAKQTEQELQSIALQKGADLVLQGQTSLSVRDTVAMTAGSEVQIQSGATLQNGAIALSAAPGTAAAQLSSKVGGNLVEMQRDTQFSIHDMLLVNTSISAAEGTAVMLSGVGGSENVHLLGGADFSLTFADNKANVGMAVIENSSPVAGITLSAGSSLTLVMDPSNNGYADYSVIINMSGFEYEGGSLAATGGITELNAAGIYLGGWLGQLLATQGVVQEGVGNLESPEVPGDSVPTVSYTYSTDNNVGMIISIHGLTVPEPTTSTLSLLALTALAMRRRRKSE